MRLLLTLLLLNLIAFSAHSQSNNHFPGRQSGWWTLGIDGGIAFQTSDVRTQWDGRGLGLTLAKNLAYRPGGLFSFDARGRLLFSRTYGADFKRSFGLQNNKSLNGTQNGFPNYLLDKSGPNDSSFVYANYKHGMGELGLEGVLTFNRLRERTGIVFSLFGGLGLDFYQTRIDQLRGSTAYNYLGINAADSRSNILSSLESLRDGVYETDADGMDNAWLKAGIMPGAGFELGYQLSNRFVIGVGHKITFSRTDILDGQRWTNENQATARNDWHHYTNLHLRWDLGRRQEKQQPPEIEITTPRDNRTTSSRSETPVRAKIRHVHQYSDVECTLNGSNQPFRFERGLFSTTAQLRPGRNEVRIRASNTAGQDEATVIITYINDNVTPAPPPPPTSTTPRPEVKITLPSRSSVTTNRDNINVQATLRHVESRREVRLTVNGAEQAFSFSEGVEANVRLREGRNEIRVEASTPGGRAWDEVVVTYEREEPTGRKPVVTITEPRAGAESSNAREYTVKADVRNVESRDDLTVYVNGSPTRSFSFNSSSGAFSTVVALQSGENDVTIRARNRYGEAEASCIIRKTGGLNIDRKPEVNILQPADGERFEVANITLKASLKNTAERNDLRVTLNGKNIADFDYDKSRQSLSAALRLNEGENTISVKAVTAEGADEAVVKVRYTAAEPPVSRPELLILEPATAGKTVRTATATLRASTRNVNSRNDVRVEHNRRGIAFDFDPRTGEINADLNLTEGDNPLFIRVKNNAGSADASSSIRYEKTPAPKVSIEKPANNAEVSNPEATLQARVEHVARKQDVSVQVNGRNIDFNFNESNGQLSASARLNEGNNSIRVSASNSSGSDNASVNVRYIKALAPVVDIRKPTNNAEFATAEASLYAVASNVYGKGDVTVQLNGRSIDFEFNAATGAVNAPLRLNEGPNTIQVRASTSAGSDAASISVRYIRAKPPVVSITAPKDQAVTDDPVCNLTAVLENITGKENVELTLNRAVVRDFSIDRGGNLSARLTLKEGKNAIRIKGTNSVGSDVAAVEITLTPRLSLDKPEVSISDPGKFRAKTSKTPYEIKARVLRAEKGGIKVFVNNTAEANFNFDAKSGNLNFQARLREGKNSIRIEASNSAGVTAATADLTYTPSGTGAGPEVSIESASQPTVNPLSPNQAKTQVLALTKNVSEKGQISCSIDGKPITDFSFDAGSGRIDFIAPLVRNAENLIEVSVTTPAGTKKATTKVKFE